MSMIFVMAASRRLSTPRLYSSCCALSVCIVTAADLQVVFFEQLRTMRTRGVVSEYEAEADGEGGAWPRAATSAAHRERRFRGRSRASTRVRCGRSWNGSCACVAKSLPTDRYTMHFVVVWMRSVDCGVCRGCVRASMRAVVGWPSGNRCSRHLLRTAVGLRPQTVNPGP